MAVIHIMADGTARASIDGLTIREPLFYQIYTDITKEGRNNDYQRKAAVDERD